jgi:hypothetical protein
MEPTQECKLYKGCGLSARPRARARERAPAHLPCACWRLSLVNLRLLVGADSRDPTKYTAGWMPWLGHKLNYFWFCIGTIRNPPFELLMNKGQVKAN